MQRLWTRRRIIINILAIVLAGLGSMWACGFRHDHFHFDRGRSEIAIGAHDRELRFYPTDGPGKPLDKRSYANTYRRDQTGSVAWELTLRGPPSKKETLFEIQAVWRFNGTDLLNVQTVFLKMERNTTEARISAAWRPPMDTGWLPGRYTVEISTHKHGLISGQFQVTTTAGYRPREPSRQPIFRLNTTNHHACLNEIETDQNNQYLVTASNDKTVRLWDLNRYRLLRVLRPPIGNGAEGRIRTVAISPDGQAIACGGRTGKSWHMSHVVYIFDRARGALIKTLKGFPHPIQDLAFSPDRRFFVAFFSDGLRVYAYPEWELVDQIKIPYRWVTRADINTKNELALATFDGHLLIFGIQGGRIVPKATGTTRSGRNPISVKYSPDSQYLAVTFRDTKDIDVYSADTLRYLYSPICAGIDRFLISAVWSSDGRSLYAGGVHEEYMAPEGKREKIFPIFCWGRRGKGERRALPIGQVGINTLCALKDGRIVYGLYDGAWGILNPEHQKAFSHPPSILHFRKLRKRCRMSPDASKVFFQYAPYPNSGCVFDIQKGRVVPWEDIAGKTPFIYPRVNHPRLDIRRWKHKRYPRLDGKPLFYHKGEISRCLAIENDGSRFILGTNHNIYCFNPNGEILWRVPVPSVTRAVQISANGKIAVSHVGDGTIRWYRMRDGKEFLAFFPHPDRKRWIAWTPDGYYMCSPHGDDLIGWHLNNGKDGAADFYTAAQFERLLYMPNYIKTSFNRLGDRPNMIRKDENQPFSIRQLAQILPPRITIVHPEPGYRNHSETLRMKFRIDRTGGRPLKDYTIYLNNIPLTPARERDITGTGDRFDHEIDLPLHETENMLRIESTGGRSMGIAETHFYTSQTQPTVIGDLYLLAIGINHFSHMPTNNLSFAVNDAQKLAERFRAEAGRTFRRVHVRIITDNSLIKPTKRAIIDQLPFFKAAGPYDTAILFLASHGFSDHAGNYFMVPCDGTPADIRRIVKTQGRGVVSVDAVDSLIGWRVFFDIFRAIPGKRLLMVDTCHSQAISGTFDMHSLAKRSASSSFALMTAAKDNEASQEFPAIKHGLFTYALLKGLSGEGDRDSNRRIVLSELYRYTFDFVSRHHNTVLGKQTPQMESPDELMDMVLGIIVR